MKRPNSRKFAVGSAYLAAGAAVLSASALRGGFVDAQGLLVWCLFAIAFAVLEWRSVEVNDRLLQSPGNMVALTAGVYFALRPGANAVFAMALLGLIGGVTPRDVRRRQLFQPAANLGQIAVTGAATGLVIQTLTHRFMAQSTSISMRIAGVESLLTIAIIGAFAAVLYATLNGLFVTIAVRLVYGSRNLVPWSGMGQLALSHILLGVLGGFLGQVLVLKLEALPVVLVVYVIGHLALSSYGQLREAHESSLRGFVKVLEARDLYTRGHTERVAYFAQLIGEELGFTGTQLERLRWAALIHDVGKLAVPVDVMGKRGRLEIEEYDRMRVHAHQIEDVLSEVEFLRPMVEIASSHHVRTGAEDFGQKGHRHVAVPGLETRVLAIADAFDAITSTRSYRMAMSQEAAFLELRRDLSPLFDDDIVETLENALARVGERYGSPTIHDEDTARSLVEEEALP